MLEHGRERDAGPLNGLRIVELGGGVAAAYCTKLLCDLGAEVIKVEPASGDPLRSHGPAPEHSPQRGSGLFQYLNAGKHSVSLEIEALSRRSDRERLQNLLTAADVCVESLEPGVLERSLEHLETVSPPRVLVRISPFGQTGPYRARPATSLVVQAAGGWVARIGTPEGPPYHVGGGMEEYVAGTYAAAAALTALRQSTLTCERASVDVSTFECMIATLPYPMLQKITFDRLGFPVPQRYQPIPGIVRCADGFVGISALTGQHWADVCAILELPELAEKMREVTLRGAEWKAFLAKAEPWLEARTAADIVELFQAVRVPAVPIGDGNNLKSLEPFATRAFFVEQPEGGFVRPDAPFRLSESPAVRPRPAPTCGEHDDAVLAGLHAAETRGPADTLSAPTMRATGRRERPSARGGGARAVPGASSFGAVASRDAAGESRSEAGASRDAALSRSSAWGGGRPGLPFSGLKVLDLTSFWAGPYLTMYLASFGADVIKIESPRRPDGFRFVAAFPQLGSKWWEQSGVYHATNLGKRDLAVDLDSTAGRELIRRLVAQADVVAENYSPRVIEHFGLGYETIRALNPRAIMLRMPGFGLEGPCRDWVGWALSFEQMAGCANLTGEPGGRMFAPGGFADPVVGMHAAVALQAALVHRESTGNGQRIEVAQVEVVTAMAAEQVIRHEISGELMSRTGNRSRSLAPQGVYRAAGRDEWIAISVRNRDDWLRLCELIGDPRLAGARELLELEGRMRNHEEIDARISAWACTLSAAQAEQSLLAAGLPAAAVLRTEDMYGEPHLEARAFFQELEHPICGRARYPGWPMRMSFAPADVHAGPAPTLGQHGERILNEVLGLTDEEIIALRSARVIGEDLR